MGQEVLRSTNRVATRPDWRDVRVSDATLSAVSSRAAHRRTFLNDFSKTFLSARARTDGVEIALRFVAAVSSSQKNVLAFTVHISNPRMDGKQIEIA
ncbi:hypothetical protein [Burkholderia anthina]|uniref:hypothetical protein n=1 Tax=Burkholderia anthina TaxID=179879 RepID=UPI00158F0B97|nr:hypothetical protein [Burkholderia anthina]